MNDVNPLYNKVLSVKLPIDTVSPNVMEHWRTRHKRNKYQAFFVKSSFLTHDKINLPCKVVMTRISSRSLDSDNLQFSFKHIRDCIADQIRPGLASGRADDTSEIEWVYQQEKGSPKEKAVRIEIFC